MQKLIPTFIIILSLLLSSCIESLGTFKGEAGVLVITGNINNQPGPYKINIAFTKQYGDISDYQSVQKANVQIIDNTGTITNLVDGYKGNYTTPEDFVGEIGKSYQLQVTLQSDESYQSDWTEIKPAIALDTIYHTIEDQSILTEDDAVTNQRTVVFWIEYQNTKDQADFLRWRYLEDFKVMAPAAFTITPDNIFNYTGFHIGDTPYKYCYARTYDTEFLKIANDLTNDGFHERTELVRFTFNRKLDLAYILEAFQHTISEKEYKYWEAIDIQHKNNGSLFETTNYQIRGNLSNNTNPDELVLGYFSVSSVSNQRVFLVKGEIPYEHFYPCEPDEFSGQIPAWCVDCREYSANSTLEKPSFWP